MNRLINLKEVKIGIVGGGVVGTATAKAWVEHVKEVRVYDIDKKKRTHELKNVVECDFVFICLPTPSHVNGKCDTNHIDKFFELVYCAELSCFAKESTFVIKSTVPIGYTKKLYETYKKWFQSFQGTLVHSPEFLTARCSLIDAQIPNRNIVGITSSLDEEDGCSLPFTNLLLERFPSTPLHIMLSDESEAVKLMCNSFFAVKIAFFNEMYKLIEKKNLDWQAIMNSVLADGRISLSHTKVPGPDGSFGYGGECLPKDIKNLRDCFAQERLNHPILEAAIDRNYEDRQRA